MYSFYFLDINNFQPSLEFHNFEHRISLFKQASATQEHVAAMIPWKQSLRHPMQGWQRQLPITHAQINSKTTFDNLNHENTSSLKIQSLTSLGHGTEIERKDQISCFQSQSQHTNIGPPVMPPLSILYFRPQLHTCIREPIQIRIRNPDQCPCYCIQIIINIVELQCRTNYYVASIEKYCVRLLVVSYQL